MTLYEREEIMRVCGMLQGLAMMMEQPDGQFTVEADPDDNTEYVRQRIFSIATELETIVRESRAKKSGKKVKEVME